MFQSQNEWNWKCCVCCACSVTLEFRNYVHMHVYIYMFLLLLGGFVCSTLLNHTHTHNLHIGRTLIWWSCSFSLSLRLWCGKENSVDSSNICVQHFALCALPRTVPAKHHREQNIIIINLVDNWPDTVGMEYIREYRYAFGWEARIALDHRIIVRCLHCYVLTNNLVPIIINTYINIRAICR